ncbi:semaphorin-4B-like isoform X1 [Oryzias latipes]|uniref:Sema domain-containing protein n=1 Tax=Oryzias latipes TaxID=8090 RepID=H2MQV9_ORYLA|nr:semaphorin-4B-like isoform X1 [Oryzias latipes]
MFGSVLLLCLLLSSSGSLPPPRRSFLLNSSHIPVRSFRLQNVTTLFLSSDSSTLYVGARDAILSLDVSQAEILTQKQEVSWRPTAKETEDCSMKGKNREVDCPNFVHALLPLNSTHLYACGSYAYSPQDAFIDLLTFSMVNANGHWRRCPYSPFQRSSALALDGELFTATTTDFKGTKPQISRHFSRDGRPDVSLDNFASLLDEPAFVSSSADSANGKIYYFFTESGNEFRFEEKLRIPRVAQVCKDDVGGRRILQKKWTSFAKASLLCRPPNRPPHNVLRDMFTLQPPEGSDSSETLFYGVFTSQWSGQSESAVCVFTLQDITTVFSGNYRKLDKNSQRWIPTSGRQLGKCGLASSSDAILEAVRSSFLTDSSVKPVRNGPVLVSAEHRYSHVAAMKTRAANGEEFTLLFLVAESGFLHKVVLFEPEPQIIEEVQLFTEPQLVRSVVLSSVKGILYVGTSEGVTAVPLATCSAHRTCSQCVLSRDPLCGWSQSRSVCTALSGSEEDVIQKLESGNEEKVCPEDRSPGEIREVSVGLNQAVRLECERPSNLAVLSWTHSQMESLPQTLFIRSPDGSLSFLASAQTLGSYSCEAEEAGLKEVVVSYTVLLKPTPRSIGPHPGVEKDFEDIPTETPTPEGSENTPDHPAPETTATAVPRMKASPDVPTASESKTNPPSFRTDSQISLEAPQAERSYLGALQVVSVLLAVCICVIFMGAFFTLRQRKAGLRSCHLLPVKDGSKKDNSMEISSLGSRKEASTELNDGE